MVAPHAGAWIETDVAATERLDSQSPLMQGRGLKPYEDDITKLKIPSPLMQGRGLKR